jgi:hypothetical protein
MRRLHERVSAKWPASLGAAYAEEALKDSTTNNACATLETLTTAAALPPLSPSSSSSSSPPERSSPQRSSQISSPQRSSSWRSPHRRRRLGSLARAAHPAVLVGLRQRCYDSKVGCLDRALLRSCSLEGVLADGGSTVVAVRAGDPDCAAPPHATAKAVAAYVRVHHPSGRPASVRFSVREGCDAGKQQSNAAVAGGEPSAASANRTAAAVPPSSPPLPASARFLAELRSLPWRLNVTSPSGVGFGARDSESDGGTRPAFAPVDASWHAADRALCAMVNAGVFIVGGSGGQLAYLAERVRATQRKTRTWQDLIPPKDRPHWLEAAREHQVETVAAMGWTEKAYWTFFGKGAAEGSGGGEKSTMTTTPAAAAAAMAAAGIDPRLGGATTLRPPAVGQGAAATAAPRPPEKDYSEFVKQPPQQANQLSTPLSGGYSLSMSQARAVAAAAADADKVGDTLGASGALESNRAWKKPWAMRGRWNQKDSDEGGGGYS